MRLSELGPQATAVWRMALAFPILIALCAAPLPRPVGRPGGWVWLAALAGLLFGADIALWHAALDLTTVANATLLSNMTPVIAGAAAWILYRERPGRGYLAGAAVALGGAALLSFGRGAAGPAADPHTAALGDALGLFSAVWYAGYLMLTARLRRSVDVRAVMAVATLAAAAPPLIAALALREPLWPQTLQGWAVLAGLALVAQIGAQGLIALGLGRLPLTVSTVLLWLQPVTAAIWGWALFNEALGPLALFGAALVLAGLYIVRRSTNA